MRVLVCGGRDYLDYYKVDEVLEGLFYKEHKPGTEFVVIQGGAKGADFLAKVWVWDQFTNPNRHHQEFPANWNKHGKAAGGIRNQQMLDEGKPDLVVAFPGGSGTADMVARARKAGVEVRIIE